MNSIKIYKKINKVFDFIDIKMNKENSINKIVETKSIIKHIELKTDNLKESLSQRTKELLDEKESNEKV